MRDTASFWDRHAARYAKRPIKNVEAYEQLVERTKAHLTGGDHVLEVGCGTASLALQLAPGVKRITATDISSKMLEIGQGKAAAEGIENIDFIRARLSDGAFPAGPFDTVLAFNFLHLVEDLPGTIERIHGLLRPGGVFISKTVCLAEKARAWRLLITVMRTLGLAPYVNYLKIHELEGLVRAQGFEIVETGAFPPTFPNRFIVARKD